MLNGSIVACKPWVKGAHAIHINRTPFGKPSSQSATHFLLRSTSRFTCTYCAVMRRHFWRNVIGDTEHQNAEIHEQGGKSLAGMLGTTTPCTG